MTLGGLRLPLGVVDDATVEIEHRTQLGNEGAKQDSVTQQIAVPLSFPR
jgi:hypothetical protein